MDVLLRGAEGGQRREATLQQLEALTRLVPVLYPDGPGICEHYTVQATTFKRRASSISGTVVSHNVSEFSRVEGLRLEDWAV